jgi:hypothetical protein
MMCSVSLQKRNAMRGKAQRGTQIRCATDCVVATVSGGIDHTS